ncbi:2404_t:CDS:2 [Diversispora eburnea]|uniref:2404_t:CDS:1 n=1 Tax=Diversispora eburnea TaxID=1213867 RepID=A0A9N8YU87_9GLOM|nr:2404_t:CDS:2 [Diversispora eburnea]
MHPRLPYDVLEEIFKYLSEDINSLHNFLLINKLWCQIVIRILWKNPWSYYSLTKPTYLTFWPLITRTIVSMIPQDSKNYLLNNGIDISKFQKKNKKFPMFNYLSYCKYFSLKDLHRIRREILDIEDSYKEFILEQVIYKLFLSNTCSLSYLELLDIPLPSPPPSSSSHHHHIDIFHKSDKLFYSFAPRIFPLHITHLEIKSHISSSLLTTLSEYVNTIRVLTIDLCDNDNPGLSQLIKSQKCLTDLKIVSFLNGVFENLSNAIKEKAKMIKCIRFVGNVCISSEAIYSLNELKVLEVDLNVNDDDDDLQQQQEIYFNNNNQILLNFPQLEILNILYDDENSLSNYTSLIDSTQNSKSLKKIFINDSFTIEFNELRPYLRSIINNCGICNNLKFVKIWYSRLLLPEIEDMLKKCTGLENLLSTHAPITLNKIELNGNWRITEKILNIFLENWNSRKELDLEMNKMNICELGFFQDCNKILKEYTDKGVLKKFNYE